MIEKTEFIRQMSEQLDSPVLSIEMAAIEASDTTFDYMNLKSSGHAPLWGLLLFCEKKLYFYVHPTESSVMNLFRTASNTSPPREQLFSFSSFASWQVRPFLRRGLFLLKEDKYRLTVEYTPDPQSISGAKAALIHRGSFVIQTQNKAAEVLKKCRQYS